MTTHRSSPLLARRRLARSLRQLRDEHGYTLEQVARELLISVSKLSRLENAQGLPQLRDVRDLASFYQQADTPTGESLLRWTRDARQKGWWTDYEDVFAPEDNTFVSYEDEAVVSLQYSLPLVPGLLQTAGYARSLIRLTRPHWTEHEVERVVETRTLRQRNLHDRGETKPLELKVILHEVCLTQSVGSPDALREQLVALQTSAKADNIDLRILPASADPHAGTQSMWQHFSFGEEVDRDVAFFETSVGIRYVEDDMTVRRVERWFAELTRRALDPVQSIAHIQDAVGRS